MRRALALLILAALAGCTTRERANPLDPLNPSTRGRPAGFVALAENHQVLLEWTPADPLLVAGYRLERAPEGSNAFVRVGPDFAPTDRSYLDLGVVNGTTYRYRFSYVTLSLQVTPSSEDLATPSPVIAWVAEDGRRSLLRLTADARRIAFEEPRFSGPTDLAVDRGRDNVWLVDHDAGQVVVYLPSIGARVGIGGFIDPQIVAVDPLTGAAWASDYVTGEVRHMLPSGGPATPPSVGPLDGPLGLDVDPRSGVLWVCERHGGKVRRYAADGTLLGSAPLATPSRVAVDSANGEAWVTSFETGLLVHFLADGTPHDTVTGFQGPVGLAVDPYRSRVWVADPVAGQLVAIRLDGSVEFRTGGLPGALQLAVEPGSGEAWVVVSGAVVRVSPTGARMVTSSGLSAPAAIALDRFGS